jgi:aminoglycoside 3-N-acetyltransferase
MLPTFNYTRPIPEPYFDPAATPGHTGAIPEAGRKHAEAVRSLHPSHSVAVIGRDAIELTGDHLKFRAFGIGSPIDRLAQCGGKVLLLGVGHISNSLIHIAEEHAGVPKVSVYPDPLPFFKIRMPDGSIIQHQLDTSPSCSSSFGGAEYILRRHNEIRDLRGLGACKAQLMSGRAVVKRVQEIIREKPDVLLCTYPGCRPCAGARRNLRAAGIVA